MSYKVLAYSLSMPNTYHEFHIFYSRIGHFFNDTGKAHHNCLMQTISIGVEAPSGQILSDLFIAVSLLCYG